MPPREPLAKAIAQRAATLIVRAPRNAPSAWLYVMTAAMAVLVIYGFATFNGYLFN